MSTKSSMSLACTIIARTCGGAVFGREERPADPRLLPTGDADDVRGHKNLGPDDAKVYLGVALVDFPNFFVLNGPNTFAGRAVAPSLQLSSSCVMRCRVWRA